MRRERDDAPARTRVYGRGIHDCPGAPLARFELRVLFEETFAATTKIEPGATDSVPARYPTGGCASIPVRLR